MDKPRWCQQWTGPQIVQVLKDENRPADAALFQKFTEVGYKGLAGGNVIFTDNSPKSKDLNEQNEKAKAAKLCLEFGWLAIEIHYLPRELLEWAASSDPTSLLQGVQ